MNNELVNKIVKEILDNEDFVNKCKKNIMEIIKDGKIDTNDVPDILSLVIDLVNETPEIEISEDKIIEVFRIIIMKLFDELNLVEDDNAELIKKLLESGLKLLKVQVKQKKIFTKIWDKLVKLFKCSK